MVKVFVPSSVSSLKIICPELVPPFAITRLAFAVARPADVNVPATAAFAPLKVIAVALLDLISLPVTVKSPPILLMVM